MDDMLKDILLQPDLFGREGQFIVLDEMGQGGELPAIVQRLSAIDRLKLFAYFADEKHQLVKSLTPAEYFAALSVVGGSINVGEQNLLLPLLELTTGRSYLRELKEVPTENPTNFNGLQDSWEEDQQNQLTWSLGLYFPEIRMTTPDEFVATRLSDEERGMALVYLMAEGIGERLHTSEAIHFVSRQFKLNLVSWNSFRSAALSVDAYPRSYGERIFNLRDKIMQRELNSLSPEDIQRFTELQAHHSMYVLSGAGAITPAYRKTQSYIYDNLPPTQVMNDLRIEQIDRALDETFQISAEVLQQWQQAKDSWPISSTFEKQFILGAYLEGFSCLLKTPSHPKVTVATWTDAPHLPSNDTDGYFLSSVPVIQDGQQELVWRNEIVVVDDVKADGWPTLAKQTFRSSIGVVTHEALHSDNHQMRVRYLSYADEGNAYVASFDEGEAPPVIDSSNPMFHTAGLLYYAQIRRASYVRAQTDSSLYFSQPTEKYVRQYENEFTACLNGRLVAHQVTSLNRQLGRDVHHLFVKAAAFLCERETLTGRSSDLTKFKPRQTTDHYFGALAWGKAEGIGEPITLDNPLDVVVYPVAHERRDALARLSETLDALPEVRTVTHPDCSQFFMQAADFLMGMPVEIFAVRAALQTPDVILEERLAAFAHESQELGEDLYDYMFVLRREAEIVARKNAETAKRSSQRVSGAYLAAVL